MGVLEIIDGRHGDIWLVSWRYMMRVLEIFDGCPEIFDKCPVFI